MYRTRNVFVAEEHTAFFSLHMWETICDARPSRMWLAWQHFCLFWQEYPILAWSRIPPPRKWKVGQILALWVQYTPPPPPNWNLGRSCHFEFWLGKNTPPPRNWYLGRSWHFEFWLLQNIPPPPENWNLGRSWYFEFWILQYTPPKKLKFRHWLLQYTPPPPPQIEI